MSKEQNKPHITKFTPPNLIHYQPIKDNDKKMIKDLSKILIHQGVISKEEDIEAMVAESSFKELLREAVANAKYEKELNPEQYDPEVERLVAQEGDFHEDWENPSLDGIDDYGNQIYENDHSSNTDNELLKRLSSESEDDAIDFVMENWE